MVLKTCVLLTIVILTKVFADTIEVEDASEAQSILNAIPAAPQQTFSKSEWAKIFKSLKPKVDNPKAARIKQPSNAGKAEKLNVVKGQVVGGFKASREQFPWQVVIYIDRSWLCGGSLILNTWILTAAHCTHQRNKFRIVLGSSDRVAVAAGGRVISTSDKYEHELFDPDTLVNDIALLRLPKNVTLSKYIGVVKLPPLSAATNTFEKTVATISGFGRTGDNSPSSRKLKFAQLAVIPNSQCAAYFGTTIVLSSNLCTQQTWNTSTCQGDSGGPLVYMDSSNSWVQIGLVSYGPASGCLSGPTGYTRVSSYLGWISDKVGKDVSGSLANTANSNSSANPPSTFGNDSQSLLEVN